MTRDELIAGLPGEALVRAGVEDIAHGRRTIPGLVVSTARTRLVRAGVLAPGVTGVSDEPELELYRALVAAGGDAYSHYNALIRELVSFEMALEHRLGQRGAV